MEYLLQEGTIELPDDFYDRTVNTFSLGSVVPAPLSVTIARDTMLPDEDMDSYVKRQVKLLQAHIKGYKLVDQQATTLPNDEETKGMQVEAYYKAEGRYYHQKQVVFEIKSKKVLVFSCTSQEKFTEAQHTLWQNLLASYKARTDNN